MWETEQVAVVAEFVAVAVFAVEAAAAAVAADREEVAVFRFLWHRLTVSEQPEVAGISLYVSNRLKNISISSL